MKDANIPLDEDPNSLQRYSVQARDCDRRADLVKLVFEIDTEAVKQGRTLKELQDKATAAAQDADLVVVNLMSLEIWSCIDTMDDLTNATMRRT